MTFGDLAVGLLDGDFTRLEPQFRRDASGNIPVIQWHAAGMFTQRPDVLAEAFTCACFNGCDEVVDRLLAIGVHPDGGNGTGMNAFHWAANRGQLAVVEKLIRAGASLEKRNRFARLRRLVAAQRAAGKSAGSDRTARGSGRERGGAT